MRKCKEKSYLLYKIQQQRHRKAKKIVQALVIISFISFCFFLYTNYLVSSSVKKIESKYAGVDDNYRKLKDFIKLKFMQQLVYIGTYEVTAYAPVPEQTDNTPEITSIGAYVQDYTVAASQDLLKSNIVSYGDIVYFYDLGKIGIIEDCMNERIKQRFDILIRDKKEVKKFGLKYSKVYRVRR